MEWKLFSEIPEYTTTEFFRSSPWVPPEWQRGHSERIRMASDLIVRVHLTLRPIVRLVDFGCGDGSLLSTLTLLGVDLYGIDLGEANIAEARAKGLTVNQGSFLEYSIQDNDFIVMTEVLEHLVDPHSFLRDLQASRAIFSSPWDENDESYYSEHAWAWDEDGYARLMTEQGWVVKDHVRCIAGFQAVYVER